MTIPKGGVGFFDSGIGGLTVLSACKKCIPGEIFYYYGDNKRAPYGNLSPSEIRKYVFAVFEKFRRLEVKAAVLACNTATAVCVEELREKYDFPIVGAEPAVFSAAKKGGEVLVLTTRATYCSARFQALCARAGEKFPSARIRPVACDLLAGVVEKCLTEKNFDFTVLLPKARPDSVVLGCTHYIYIEEIIRGYYGCEIYHGNLGMARRLQAVLREDLPAKWELESKNRDGRPPKEKIDEKSPVLTTNEREKEKANKRSRNLTPKFPKKPENRANDGLFFLGSSKKINEKIHKQMFTFKSGG